MKLFVVRSRKMNPLNINDLVERTTEFMRKNQINNLILQESLRKSSSVWYNLCVHVFNNYVYKNALRIKTMWLRDQWSYRSKVISNINQLSEKDCVKFDNQAIIVITKKEWEDIQRFISGSKRQKFNSLFTSFLANKLQGIGINCWVVNRYNWLYKGEKLFWKGVYNCFQCGIIYECKIEPIQDLERIEIIVYWKDKCKHEKLEKKCKKRLTGLVREETAMKIISNGGVNFEANCFNNRKLEIVTGRIFNLQIEYKKYH